VLQFVSELYFFIDAPAGKVLIAVPEIDQVKLSDAEFREPVPDALVKVLPLLLVADLASHDSQRRVFVRAALIEIGRDDHVWIP
jgi:hypothetical protein